MRKLFSVDTIILLAAVVWLFVFVGCSFFRSAKDEAKHALIDCTKGELANLKPVAIAMAKAEMAGALTWDDVKGTAIQSGARVGGCILAHLHDAIPKPMGFVGEPTQPELLLVDLRAATHTDYAYRTESGAH